MNQPAQNKLINKVKQGTFQCKICTNANPESQKISFCDSGHQVCQMCLKSYVEAQLNTSLKQINCPFEKCEQKLSFKSRQKLPSSLKQKYDKLNQSLMQIKQGIKFCPQCNIQLISQKDSNNLFCQKCKRNICRQCLGGAHEFRGKCQVNVLFQLKQKFRQCSNCHFLVQKSQGCDHMACICGHNFCYNCGKIRLGYHDHTCQSRERKRSL